MSKHINDVLGYCCICTALRSSKPSVFTSRSIPKRTFTESLRDERALQNVRDLFAILQWNEQHDIRVFRISSEMFPRATCAEFGYDILKLPDITQIATELKRCGEFAKSHDHKISFHPGPYTCLGSPNEEVRKASIREVEMHSTIADLIDPDDTLDIPINFHVGGSYGGQFRETAARFIDSYNQLSDNAKKRVVIENDDKPTMWSTRRLYKLIYETIGVPITFDLHHWLFCHEEGNMFDDFRLAYSTWGNRSMQVHYSQSPSADNVIPKHSEYYRDPMPKWINGYANTIHVHLECKAKEQALLDYRRQFSKVEAVAH